MDLQRYEKVLPYQILAFTSQGKTWKANIKKANIKYQLLHGVINLNNQTNH